MRRGGSTSPNEEEYGFANNTYWSEPFKWKDSLKSLATDAYYSSAADTHSRLASGLQTSSTRIIDLPGSYEDSLGIIAGF